MVERRIYAGVPQVWDENLKRYVIDERTQANEETPLSLSNAQRLRLYGILKEECGVIDAVRIMKRIEAEA